MIKSIVDRWFESRDRSLRQLGNQIVCRHFGGRSRVFRGGAPILELNGAMSAPDSDLKTALEENFPALMTNRTVIAIGHRLSAIAAPDGLIARVWKRQLVGFFHQHGLAGTRPAQ